ncbi:hypothetical protein [Kribbella sp. NPDC000426]|uniref:hypothetical protein n=1 Tax=Kribbella sp. NPDC000426 TaxID=3154255 RepID=UPI00332A4738
MLSEAKDLLGLLVEGKAVKRSLKVQWRGVSQAESALESIEDLDRVASLAAVETLFARIAFSDASILLVQIEFGEDRSSIATLGSGEARAHALRIEERLWSIRKAPRWLLRFRDWCLGERSILGGLVAPMAMVILGLGTSSLLVMHENPNMGVFERDSIIPWCIFLAGILLAFGSSSFLRGRRWFELMPDGSRAPRNWDVIWSAVGAIAGIAGIIIAVAK